MADNTKIEWTDATWNPITGCSVVSPGCTNCYAMLLAGTRLSNHPSRIGLTRDTKGGPVWTGEVRFNEGWLDQPLRWRRPRMIFVCAHGDLFAEGVPDEWIDRVFAVMALAPQHVFQVLTKRADRMRAYLSGNRFGDGHATERIGYAAMQLVDEATGGDETKSPPWPYDPSRISSLLHGPTPDSPIVLYRRREIWPLPNVWLGVSAEDQRRADERVPQLLATPTAIRWVSAEPLLGPIDFRDIKPADRYEVDALTGYDFDQGGVRNRLDWIVAGGESGHGARPMHPSWVRSIRDQCAKTGVAFLFKQWGALIESDQLFDRSARSDAVMIYRDGQRWAPPRPLNFTDAAWLGDFLGHRYEQHSDGSTYYRIGKAGAGRILDGATHDGFPVANVGPSPIQEGNQ
ncbi:phage Gp37/Gp68 family protein [Aureimonas sp. SK2]|uniref:phage Gp37/Gp68 family protein n=1 Tax=Aureimonas sp. SK2 TaxID=3015992 RepID=UPI002443C1B6|nr:phage Gp37/Gp68 family protein [Aureimonas sp. SK2]